MSPIHPCSCTNLLALNNIHLCTETYFWKNYTKPYLKKNFTASVAYKLKLDLDEIQAHQPFHRRCIYNFNPHVFLCSFTVISCL